MNDNLPPLPDPDWTETRPTNPPRHGQHWYGEAKMQAYARAAILAERERCAKVCEEIAAPAENTERAIWWNTAVHQCAAAIREGGK